MLCSLGLIEKPSAHDNLVVTQANDVPFFPAGTIGQAIMVSDNDGPTAVFKKKIQVCVGYMDLKTLPALADGCCRIYFCRHGQTKLNAGGIVQGGSIDEPLNSLGMRQAKKMSEGFKRAGVVADVVVTSALARAKETAVEIEGKVRLGDAGLNEMYYGCLEGKDMKEVDTLVGIKKMLVQWSLDDRHFKLSPDAESYDEIAQRSRKVLESILCTHNPRHLVVVAHARLTKVLVTDLLDQGPAFMGRIPHDNCGVSVIDVTHKEPFVYDKVVYNLTSHL